VTVLSLGKEKLELYRELVNNKVITIGIDGATFRIIDSLMLDGELPTLYARSTTIDPSSFEPPSLGILHDRDEPW
jgi:hypothetical protein